MTKALLWIGGATLATVLLFGGAAIGTRMMYADTAANTAATAPNIEDAIPVDPSKFDEDGNARSDSDQFDPGTVTDASLSDETVEGDGTDDDAGLDAEDHDGEVIYDARSGASGASRSVARSAPSRASRSEPMVVKRVLPIKGPIKYGEWHWDTKGVPPGPIVITVDLDARVISVFRGGYEIGAAAVLVGTQEHPTPLGVFPIRYKMRDNVSEKYNNAPMPYSMFLTNDGVALHGSQVENGYASHGCIGLPNEFAAKVFAVAKKGDKVVITRGETLKMGESIL